MPQRSVSYSNLEGLQTHQQYPSFHHVSSAEHYTTKPRSMHTGMYPPPISTPTNPISAGETPPVTANPPHQAQSGGPLPPAPYPTWQQPYSYQKPAVSSSEPFGAWSAPPGLPTPVVEDRSGSIPYGYGEPAGGGIFYPAPPNQGRQG